MVKHTQTIRRQIADELFVLDHFVKLELKGLKQLFHAKQSNKNSFFDTDLTSL